MSTKKQPTITKSKLTSLINEEVKRRMRAKLLESELEGLSQLDTQRRGYEEPGLTSELNPIDTQTAIDSVRDEANINELDPQMQQYLDGMLAQAKEQGLSFGEVLDYVVKHKEDIKRYAETDSRQEPINQINMSKFLAPRRSALAKGSYNNDF